MMCRFFYSIQGYLERKNFINRELFLQFCILFEYFENFKNGRKKFVSFGPDWRVLLSRIPIDLYH